jgi:hypothetical protein
MPVPGMAGFYDYQADLSALGQGMNSYVVGWPASGVAALSATRVVRKDTIAPMVQVLPQGTAFTRDELARVQVTSTEAPRSGTLAVTLQGSDAGIRGLGALCDGGTMCMPASTFCQCFEVDMARPALAGLDGGFVVAARLEDEGGNSSSATGTVAVTRLRWLREISLSNQFVPVQPVAVSRTGTIIAAVQERPNPDSRVVAYTPTGAPAWSGGGLTAGTVTAGPVVGANTMFVATQTVTSQIQPVSLATGMLQTVAECIGGSTFNGDMALATLGGGQELVLGIRDGFLSITRPTCPAYDIDGPMPSDVTTRPALVVQVDGGVSVEAFVAYEGDTTLWKAASPGTAWSSLGSVLLPGGPQQTKSLFFNGTGRVGGGGGVGNGTYFMTSSVGPLQQSVNTIDTVSVTNSGPATHGAGALYYGTSTTLGRIVIQPGGMLTLGNTVTPGVGSFQGASPVLGAGGLVYALSGNGTLTARRQSDLSEVWSGVLSSLSGVSNLTQMALDVYRDSAGGKQCPNVTGRNLGVLYVLTRESSTARLRAIIVDSPGLDSTAPWPKYQRDNGNTGNINSDMSFWTCP